MMGKKRLIYSNHCTFFVDTNNLISIEMFNKIIDKIDEKTIQRLNEVLNGIKFYVGGSHWHLNKAGYIKYPTFEYNFQDKTLLIFLYKIFDLGYKRWRNSLYGSLKRYIWESFCHEIIMSLVHVIKLNLNLIDLAKDYYLNDENDFNKKFISELFGYQENYPLRVNFILINNSIWHEDLPPELNFLNILYNRKMNELKRNLNEKKSSTFFKIKFFNELRKIKLNYEYEYNLSELINYCIHNNYFEMLFRNNLELYHVFYREFYYKAKRQILRFFKQYKLNSELKEYKDSTNRTHFFITHKTFERVKSACLQTCIANLKNQALNDYINFKTFYSKCPICKSENANQDNCERFFFSPKFSYFKAILSDKMNKFENLEKLNDVEYYFGIPCEKCYKIVRNIQGKFSELDQVQKFVLNYGSCPICGIKNHENYLLSFYHDDSKEELRDFLVKHMDSADIREKYKIIVGIPCCECFSKVFEDEPNIQDIYYSF